jgi:hypothetical protein
MKRAACSTGLAFVWQNQEECNFREIRKLVTQQCNDMERKKHTENIQRSVY